MSAPLYYLAGIFLDLITFNRLNYIYIQHLIIIFGAIFSAIFMFYSLIKINPELKIEAALISILYITSPGLASLMFYMDSYYAFLAVTFIPLVLISLFLINKVNSYKSYLLFSISLALTWMAHPPIALWTTIVSLPFVFFLIFESHKRLKFFIFSGLIFIGLILWQLVAISNFSTLTPFSAYEYTKLLNEIQTVLANSARESLYPLNTATKSYFWFQLGYGLWVFLILGLLIFIRKPKFNFFFLLIFSSLFLIILLMPNPIGTWIWHQLPKSIVTITNFYPNARIYSVLAALASFITFFVIDIISKKKSSLLLFLLKAILVATVVWSTYQTTFLMNKAIQQTEGHINMSWLNTDNMLYSFYGMNNDFLTDEFYSRSKIPEFQVRLLDSIASDNVLLDNKLKLLQKCYEGKKFELREDTHNQNRTPKHSVPLSNFNLSSNSRYLFCGKTKVNQNYVIYYIANDEIKLLHSSQIKNKDDIWQDVIFPLSTNINDHINDNGSIPVVFSLTPADHSIAFLKDFHYTTFTKDDFDINILSLTPFTVSVISRTSKNTLEVIKPFQNGYTALVNGVKVIPLKSKRDTISIPLNTIGKSIVTLTYEGTRIMHYSYWISIITWIFALFFLFAGNAISKKLVRFNANTPKNKC